jgi:cobalt-zinc-cadmium efflux system outer membrane protein
LTDVRTQFYRALIAQRRFESAEKLVGIAEEAAEVAEKLLQAKEGRRIDVLQARVEAARAKLALRKTKNRHIAAWRALAAVVGNADLPRGPLEGDIDSALPTLEWQSSLEYVLNDSPELAAATVDIERAQRTLQRELAKASPNWDAELKVQYDTEADDMVAGISVGLPIPSRNRNQGAIHRAEAEIVAAEQELHRLEFLLQQRLASAFQNYADARLTVAKHADDILPNAKQTIDLVTQGFEAGEVPYVDLLTAQRTLFQANLEYMDSLEQLWSAVKYIEGFALHKSLSQMKN